MVNTAPAAGCIALAKKALVTSVARYDWSFVWNESSGECNGNRADKQVARGNLQTLDFTRVKQTLRESARKLFVDEETQNPTPLALQLSAQKGGAPVAAPIALPSTQKSSKGRLMTPEEKKRVVEAIKRAKTGEEVRKLERMLADGVVPDGGVDAATQED